MKTTLISGLFVLLSTSVMAGGEDELIELDKTWGSASVAGNIESVADLFSDDLVAVGASGIGGKAEELADNEPAPDGSVYSPADYTVTFLDEHTAVMAHSTTGENAHYSLHVWSNASGNWQVVATSSVPIDSD